MKGDSMWKWISVVLVLLVATPSWAQTPVHKPLHTFQDAVSATGNGTSIQVQGWATIGVQVTIADTATVTFESTVDPGTSATWASSVCTSVASTSGALVTTATATGVYYCNISGMAQFRVRVSSWTAGTVTVTGLVTLVKRGGSGGGGASGTASAISSSDTLPASCTAGDKYFDTDATSGSREYVCDSANTWVALLTAETQTLDNVFDQGKTIDGANSVANAVRIGDGTTPVCIYTDATLGPQIRPCTDANVKTVVPTNFEWSLYDEEGAAAIESVNPDAASTLLVWQYPTATYRPKKSVWFGAGSLSTDGTQCAAPAEVTINSGPKIWTIICTDNDASTIYGSVKLPDNYDGGTFTFDHVYIQTAADTAVLNGDIAAQCRGNGEVPSSTWGTEIAIDDAAVVGSNSNDMTTSAAVTAAGTCAAGDMLYWRYQLDATGTTTAVATLHHVGFRMEYSETSRSQ
jgi:hypothetical protein